MNCVCDYLGFVVWFTGLGYVVLWLVGSPEHRMLPPALHGLGLLSATFVCVRLIVLAIGRWRGPAAAANAAGRAPSRAAGGAAVRAAAPAAHRQAAQSIRPARHAGLKTMA